MKNFPTEKWSKEMISFTNACLTYNQTARPTSAELLKVTQRKLTSPLLLTLEKKHPFLDNACSKEEFATAIQNAFQNKKGYGRRTSKNIDDESDEFVDSD
jgi:hypothetical protein